MKREVPIAQFFFLLRHPVHMQQTEKRSTQIPALALHLTTQPQNTNCVMKYIFNWPVYCTVQSYIHVPLIYDKC